MHKFTIPSYGWRKYQKNYLWIVDKNNLEIFTSLELQIVADLPGY
jgi:hypothetical protein